jgi:ribosome-binding protein aMBF1 (putative translation factor)
MAQPPDLEARVTALEEQVRDLGERVRTSRQDAAAAVCSLAARIAT